jgi:hypothetical protein
MREPFRIEPMGPPQAYKTYTVRSPLATHYRPATCAEVDCPNHQHGWQTIVDERTTLGMQQAAWIRQECRTEQAALAFGAGGRRRYVETRDDALTVFTFGPGQTCFAQHQVPLGRPEFYLVRAGDWRGNGGLIRRHQRAADWVEDCAEHQDRIAHLRNQG